MVKPLQINEYEEEIIVAQYECDLNGRMKPGAMLSQCQAVSTAHCNSIGMTIEKYRQTKTIFLLAKVSLEIYQDIKVGDRLLAVTQAYSPVRAVYSRRTQFLNEQKQRVAEQDSKWVLVDTNTRKILRMPPEELEFPFDRTPPETSHDFSIHKSGNEKLVGEEKVTYSRTDDNGHLNNTQYADIILDNLPIEVTEKYRVEHIVINYHKEALLKDTLEIQVGQKDDFNYYVSGKIMNGKTCFESMVKFASEE